MMVMGPIRFGDQSYTAAVPVSVNPLTSQPDRSEMQNAEGDFGRKKANHCRFTIAGYSPALAVFGFSRREPPDRLRFEEVIR